ncbi:NlpC/P60 family protein [Paenibacillus sp. GCM10027626]|uniref:NlpC/P60 family protein n=1 Tax=Paenibacillus sp. GCM10027626 TaxID=3273411 RepID=UPI00362939AE
MDVQQHLPEGELDSEVIKLALTRLGDPYSQPKAGQDDYTDCSYLVQWVYRELGINLPRTAAEQARFSVENGLTVSAADLIFLRGSGFVRKMKRIVRGAFISVNVGRSREIIYSGPSCRNVKRF